MLQQLTVATKIKWFVCFSYEPELFPGLIYRMIKPRIVLLIFVSGKVVLTGETCSLLVASLHPVICQRPKVILRLNPNLCRGEVEVS